MRNSDKWVRWNDRDDLQERFAILTEISNYGTSKFFFTVSKFPDELLGEVTERLDAELECFSQCTEGRTHYTLELLTFKELTDEYRIRAIRERREGGMRSVCFYAVRVRRIISDIEYRYEAQYELAAAGAAQSSTVDADAEQTAPAALEHVTAATSSTDKESEGGWIRADVWAADHATVDGRFSKTMKDRIRNNLSSARERNNKTNRQYRGRDIYTDSAGREYFKEGYRTIFYKKEQLDKDLEILTSRNH